MPNLAARRARAVKTVPPLISAIDALLKEQNEQLANRLAALEALLNTKATAVQ